MSLEQFYLTADYRQRIDLCKSLTEKVVEPHSGANVLLEDLLGELRITIDQWVANQGDRTISDYYALPPVPVVLCDSIEHEALVRSEAVRFRTPLNGGR